MRPWTVVALSLFLVVSSVPIAPAAVFAAPPDTGTELEAGEPASASGSESSDAEADERARLRRLPDKATDDREAQGEPASSKRELQVQGWSGFDSIRRRGLETPFDLRQPEPEPAPIEEEPDKGDGEPPQNRSSSEEDSRSDSEKERNGGTANAARSRDIRIWPMRADSYTFTQAFGCVPQIANFYFPGEGCPPSAPVVHSGIDLGAPEGTPFYAAASGWVTGSGYDREVGVPNTRIIIQHDGRNDGFATEYLHWIASFVEVGDYVEAGEQIGEVGNVGYSTGAHLHFSVVDLDSGEHVDPVRWLPDEPGSQGYRGIRPNARADMRLPAGTTAGLPEEADPAPPPPPEREDVPESPPPSANDGGDNGKDRSAKKRKRDREERRDARESKNAENQPDGTGEESADAPATATEKTVKEGKNTERTRKRERNKDGKQEERSAKGDDGGKRKSDDRERDGSRDKETNKDRRDNRDGGGNGNGNGRHNDRSDDKDKDKEHKTNDRDRIHRDKPEDNGGDDGADPSGDDGGSGTDPDGDGSDRGDDGTGADTPGDDGGTDDGDDAGDGQPAEDSTNDDSDGKGGDAKSDGEATAAQPADDSTVKPVKEPKDRKRS